MALTPNSVITVQTPKITPQNFVAGTDAAGTLKTLFTAGTNGSKITACSATTDDGSAAHVFTIYLTRSAVDYYLGMVNVPVNALGGAVSSVDLLSLIPGLPVDNDGQKYLFLESGDTFRGTYATALTAAKRIDVATIGANF